MSAQRPIRRVTRPDPPGKDAPPDLTAPEVLNHALTALETHVRLPRPAQAQYGPGEIFEVLLYAAAHRTIIEQGCAALAEAPHPNTVRGALTAVELAELEDQLNTVLVHRLPKGLG